MDDIDITPSATNLINGFFLPNKDYTKSNLTENRNLIIPSAKSIIDEIPNCIIGTSFQFIINNCQGGSHNRKILPGTGITIDDTAYNGFEYIEIGQGITYTFLVVVNNISLSSESITIYTINKSNIS